MRLNEITPLRSDQFNYKFLNIFQNRLLQRLTRTSSGTLSFPDSFPETLALAEPYLYKGFNCYPIPFANTYFLEGRNFILTFLGTILYSAHRLSHLRPEDRVGLSPQWQPKNNDTVSVKWRATIDGDNGII